MKLEAHKLHEIHHRYASHNASHALVARS